MRYFIATLGFAVLLPGCTIGTDGTIRPQQAAAVQGSNDAQGNPISASGGMGVGAGSAGVGPGAIGAGSAGGGGR